MSAAAPRAVLPTLRSAPSLQAYVSTHAYACIHTHIHSNTYWPHRNLNCYYILFVLPLRTIRRSAAIRQTAALQCIADDDDAVIESIRAL